MLRLVPCCALVAALALPCRADEAAKPPETAVGLSVQAAPEAAPALRYTLLPELKDIKPGNPVQNYMKCFMAQQHFFHDRDVLALREKLLKAPLADLPSHNLRNYGGYALRQADWAARLATPDWDVLESLRKQGYELLAPDLQEIRTLASALKVRFRAEVASGQFDDAVRTAQTMLAAARHLSDHPTFIGNLVGLVFVDSAVGPLEEMLAQDSCPNLYWAFTNLPSPLVSLAKGIQGERMCLEVDLRGLQARSAMSKEQLETFVARMDKRFRESKLKGTEKGVRAWLAAAAGDAEAVGSARERLVAGGLAADRVRQFPAEQVILLVEKLKVDTRFDEFAKTIGLPFWQAEAFAGAGRSSDEPSLFADVFVTQFRGVRLKAVRVEQRLAMLRVVEGIRLHAAAHKGELPSTLADIEVPLPVDPVTCKPFSYEASGQTAHLRGTPPAGQEKDAAYCVHYEITLRK